MGIVWTAPLRKLSVALLVGCTLLAIPASARTAPAAAHPLVGIGDENLALFSDPRFLALGITQVRFYVSWDVLSSAYKKPLPPQCPRGVAGRCPWSRFDAADHLRPLRSPTAWAAACRASRNTATRSSRSTAATLGHRFRDLE